MRRSGSMGSSSSASASAESFLGGTAAESGCVPVPVGTEAVLFSAISGRRRLLSLSVSRGAPLVVS